MTTGNAELTSNSQTLRPILEDGVAKLLNSFGGRNVFTAELPPVTTSLEFTNQLQVHRGLYQPEYEGWFLHRRNISVDSSASSSQFHYNQVHGMMIVGLAYHATFHDSYVYIQDQTEKLIWNLEKNKNLLGDDNIQVIQGVNSRFEFEQFGEMYMYKSITTFDVQRLTIEASGRNFTG